MRKKDEVRKSMRKLIVPGAAQAQRGTLPNPPGRLPTVVKLKKNYQKEQPKRKFTCRKPTEEDYQLIVRRILQKKLICRRFS